MDINDAALLAMNGGNSNFIIDRGIDLYNEGDYVMAKYKFEEALKVGNKDAEEWIDKCNRGIIDKFYPKALQHLREDEPVRAANAFGTIYSQTYISFFKDLEDKCLCEDDMSKILSYCVDNYETQVVRKINNNCSDQNDEKTVSRREESQASNINTSVYTEKRKVKVELPPQIKEKILPVGVDDDFDFREKDIFETEQEYKERFARYQEIISKQQVVLGYLVINNYDGVAGVALPDISLNKNCEVFGVKITPINIDSIVIPKTVLKEEYKGKKYEIVAFLQTEGDFYSDIKVNLDTIKIKITGAEFYNVDVISYESNVLPNYILPLGTASPIRESYDINKKSLSWKFNALDIIPREIISNFYTIVERDIARSLCNTSDSFNVYGVIIGTPKTIKVRIISSPKLGVFYVSNDNKLVNVNTEYVISNLNIHQNCEDYIYTPFYADIKKVKELKAEEARLKAKRQAEEKAKKAEEEKVLLLLKNGVPKNIESIAIPKSVTRISDKAFWGCSSLTSIVIPDSVTSIGDLAFRDCSSLTSIVIPDSVTRIGDDAFMDCSSLTSIVIPDSVTSIGSRAFYGCESLISIEIPKSVTRIGDSAFSGCSSLTSIAIPKSVSFIDKGAFSGCSSLTSIEIPKSVTRIGGEAFRGCSSLTSIAIPDGECGISNYTFCGCSSLTSIVIPDSVTSIGMYAFRGCSSLTSIAIPDSVTSIGVYAECAEGTFEGCNNLKNVYMNKALFKKYRKCFGNVERKDYQQSKKQGAQEEKKSFLESFWVRLFNL